MVLVVGGIVAFLIFGLLNSQLGKYELSGLIEQAAIIQQDLSREIYGQNSFDIGEIDGTFTGMLSKAPMAISASLFRPFIWEIKNPVMLLSGLENTAILIMVIFMLIKIKPRMLIRIIINQPIIVFSLFFSMILAYSIGISTANFGALVRYKIPLIPYFVSSILVIQYFYKLGDVREMKKEMSLD